MVCANLINNLRKIIINNKEIWTQFFSFFPSFLYFYWFLKKSIIYLFITSFLLFWGRGITVLSQSLDRVIFNLRDYKAC